jgi:SAM-dependent methyltransferase
MNFDSNYFPKYNELTFLEKFILRTCCYFPPIKRRERTNLMIDIPKYAKILSSAFGGEVFWVLVKDKTVLDFGCGEGGFVLSMASKINCIVHGIDIQDEFQVANTYIQENKLTNAKLILGNSEILQDATYDVIISHDSFEHFEDPELVLNEMVRLLKPNGQLLIKFGPTWMSPYGRHMSGTFKKNQPWIHLFIPEKNMMRVHSVYHNDEMLYEKYNDLLGGLNKMTIGNATRLLNNHSQLKIESTKITAWRGLKLFIKIPILKELFGSGVTFICRKNKI